MFASQIARFAAAAMLVAVAAAMAGCNGNCSGDGCLENAGSGPGRPSEQDQTCTTIAAPASPALALGLKPGADFVEVPSGAELGRISGVQGGSHSFVTARVALTADLSPAGQPWAIRFSVTSADNMNVASASRFRVTPCGATWAEIPNEPVFWTGGAAPGTPLTVTASLVDETDFTAVYSEVSYELVAGPR